MGPEQLVENSEHEQEWGGYFIIRGHEKVMRMLLMTKRNYPIAMRRLGWKSRGALFSDMGIQIRCVKNDQTASVGGTFILVCVLQPIYLVLLIHKLCPLLSTKRLH